MSKGSCYIYTRVSTAAQVDGYSLDAQLDALRKYAEFKEFSIAGEYCDAGRSGMTIDGRPSFCRMMEDVMSMKSNVRAVLVFKLSRFGRNSADILESIRRLEDCGVSLISVNEGIDSSSSSGRLTLAILSAVAEMEHDNIRVQFMAGKLQKIRTGAWTGGTIPFGYRNTASGLVPDPTESEIVREIFELYCQEGSSASSVAVAMNESQYRRLSPKTGEESPFTFEFVSHILDNPIYCGRVWYNRRSSSEAFMVKGLHEAIVSGETWDLAHSKRLDKAPRKPKTNPAPYMLSGLVRCPFCGKGLVGTTYTTKRRDGIPGNYRPISYYYCQDSKSQNGKKCSFSTKLNQDVIDRLVTELLGRLQFTAEFHSQLKSALCTDDSVGTIEQELRRMLKELRSTESFKEKLGGQIDGLDPLDEDYDSRYDHLSEKLDEAYDDIDRLEDAIAETRKRLEQFKVRSRAYDDVSKFLENIKVVMGNMSPEERRNLCRSIIAKIEVFPEDRSDGKVIRSVSFRFPVGFDGRGIPKIKDDNGSICFTLDCSDIDIEISEKSGLAIKVNDDGSIKVVVRKPTYGSIKAYVDGKYGTKVSSLYIAQTKRKYGLDVGEAYNKPEKGKSRILNCPEDKEKKILEALKHFGLVPQDTAFIGGRI